jgi:hypothetical protein
VLFDYSLSLTNKKKLKKKKGFFDRVIVNNINNVIFNVKVNKDMHTKQYNLVYFEKQPIVSLYSDWLAGRSG